MKHISSVKKKSCQFKLLSMALLLGVSSLVDARPAEVDAVSDATFVDPNSMLTRQNLDFGVILTDWKRADGLIEVGLNNNRTAKSSVEVFSDARNVKTAHLDFFGLDDYFARTGGIVIDINSQLDVDGPKADGVHIKSLQCALLEDDEITVELNDCGNTSIKYNQFDGHVAMKIGGVLERGKDVDLKSGVYDQGAIEVLYVGI